MTVESPWFFNWNSKSTELADPLAVIAEPARRSQREPCPRQVKATVASPDEAAVYGDVVRAFNSVFWRTLESDAHRKGERAGIPLASDDPAA